MWNSVDDASHTPDTSRECVPLCRCAPNSAWMPEEHHKEAAFSTLLVVFQHSWPERMEVGHMASVRLHKVPNLQGTVASTVK